MWKSPNLSLIFWITVELDIVIVAGSLTSYQDNSPDVGNGTIYLNLRLAKDEIDGYIKAYLMSEKE